MARNHVKSCSRTLLAAIVFCLSNAHAATLPDELLQLTKPQLLPLGALVTNKLSPDQKDFDALKLTMKGVKSDSAKNIFTDVPLVPFALTAATPLASGRMLNDHQLGYNIAKKLVVDGKVKELYQDITQAIDTKIKAADENRTQKIQASLKRKPTQHKPSIILLHGIIALYIETISLAAELNAALAKTTFFSAQDVKTVDFTNTPNAAGLQTSSSKAFITRIDAILLSNERATFSTVLTRTKRNSLWNPQPIPDSLETALRMGLSRVANMLQKLKNVMMYSVKPKKPISKRELAKAIENLKIVASAEFLLLFDRFNLDELFLRQLQITQAWIFVRSLCLENNRLIDNNYYDKFSTFMQTIGKGTTKVKQDWQTINQERLTYLTQPQAWDRLTALPSGIPLPAGVTLYRPTLRTLTKPEEFVTRYSTKLSVTAQKPDTWKETIPQDKLSDTIDRNRDEWIFLCGHSPAHFWQSPTVGSDVEIDVSNDPSSLYCPWCTMLRKLAKTPALLDNKQKLTVLQFLSTQAPNLDEFPFDKELLLRIGALKIIIPANTLKVLEGVRDVQVNHAQFKISLENLDIKDDFFAQRFARALQDLFAMQTVPQQLLDEIKKLNGDLDVTKKDLVQRTQERDVALHAADEAHQRAIEALGLMQQLQNNLATAEAEINNLQQAFEETKKLLVFTRQTLNNLKDRWGKMLKELNTLREKDSLQQDELEQLRTEVEQATQTTQDKDAALAKLQDQLDAAAQEKSKLEERLATQQQQLEQAQKRIQELEGELTAAQAALTEAQARADQAAKEKADADAEVDRLIKTLRQAHDLEESLNNENDMLREEATRAATERDEAAGRAVLLQDQINKLQQALQGAEERAKAAKDAQTEAEEKSKDMQSQLDVAAETNTTSAAKINDLKKQLATAQTTADQAAKEKNAVDAEVERLQKELAQNQRLLEWSTEREIGLNNENYTLREAAARAAIERGEANERNQLTNEEAAKRTALLQGQINLLQKTLADAQKRAKSAEDAQTKAETSSQALQAQLEEAEGTNTTSTETIENLETQLAKEKDKATQARSEQKTATAETEDLKGQLREAQQRLAALQETTETFARRGIENEEVAVREALQLQHQVALLKQALAAAQKRAQASEDAQTETKQRVQDLQLQLDTATATNQTSEAERTELKDALDEANRAAKKAKKDAEEARNKANNLNNELGELKTEMSARIQHDRSRITAANTLAEQAKSELARERARAEDAATKAQAEIANLTRQLSALRNETNTKNADTQAQIKRLQKELAGAQQRLAKAQQDMEELERRAMVAEEGQGWAEITSQAAAARIVQLQKDLVEAKQQKTNAQTQMNETKSLAAQLQAELEEANRKRNTTATNDSTMLTETSHADSASHTSQGTETDSLQDVVDELTTTELGIAATVLRKDGPERSDAATGTESDDLEDQLTKAKEDVEKAKNEAETATSRITELETEIANTKASLEATMHERDTGTASLSERDNQISSLTQEKNANTAELEKLREQIAELKTKLREAQEKAERARMETEDKESQTTDAQLAADTARKEVERLTGEVATLTSNLTDAATANTAATQTAEALVTAQAELEEARKKQSYTENEQNRLTDELEALKAQLLQNTIDLEEPKDRAKIEDEEAVARKNLTNRMQWITDLDKTLKSISTEKNLMIDQINKLRRELEEAKEMAKQKAEATTQANLKVQNAEASMSKLENQLKEASIKAEESQTEIDKLTRDVSTLTEQVELANQATQTMQQTINTQNKTIEDQLKQIAALSSDAETQTDPSNQDKGKQKVNTTETQTESATDTQAGPVALTELLSSNDDPGTSGTEIREGSPTSPASSTGPDTSSATKNPSSTGKKKGNGGYPGRPTYPKPTKSTKDWITRQSQPHDPKNAPKTPGGTMSPEQRAAWEMTHPERLPSRRGFASHTGNSTNRTINNVGYINSNNAASQQARPSSSSSSDSSYFQYP